MCADKVRTDYENLRQIAQVFSQQADLTRQTLQRMQQDMDLLQQGDWIGKSADKFYAEMTTSVLPGVKRLGDALARAQQVTQQISAIMKEAENDAAALFKLAEGSGHNGNGGSATTAPDAPAEGEAQAAEEQPALPKWVTDLLAGVFLGDFSENSALLKLLAQIAVGFTPAAPLADARDIVASIKDIIQGKEGGWIGLALSVLAIVPSLDALKGLKALRPVFEALGVKGSREVVEYLFKNPQEIGRVAKSIVTLLDHPQVMEALAKNPEAMMLLIRKGSPELVESFAKHGDEAIQLALQYGDDGAYIATQYDRYQPLAADPAHAGIVSEKTLRESGVGLALEGRGQLPGPIVRYPTPAAEFTDATGQAWDVKTFNSNFPPKKGGFEVNKTMREIKSELDKNENIILDTKDLTPAHIAQLKEAIEKAGIQDQVLWYP
jgi:WXG100 family type VII secretion target